VTNVLSYEDRVAIDALLAGYAYAFDTGDGEAFADLFTPDGSFVNVGVATMTGRDELVDFVNARFEQAPGVRHFTANVLVEPNGDGATGRAYVWVIRLDGDGPLRLRNTGEYTDEFVRTAAGWRFAKRTFSSWVGADLVDAPFTFGTP
jgi:uncharacterized protein (TIGR02246 family)